MKRILSLIAIGLLGLSMFLMFTFGTAKAQEIVWNTNPTPLPTALSGSGSVVYNDRIYMLGGTLNPGDLGVADVYFAETNSDGTIDSWIETESLPESRCHSTTSVVAWNNFIYFVGGCVPGGAPCERSTVWYAQINPDGTLGSWMSTTPLPWPSRDHITVVSNGRIYVGGGTNGYGLRDDVIYANINIDGSLGAWTYTTPLPIGMLGMGALVHNGEIYLIGGISGWGGPGLSHSEVYHAFIDFNGSVGSWNPTTPLPEGRYWARTALVDGNIYVVGGGKAPEPWPERVKDTVWSAKINEDSTVGSWMELQSIPQALIEHSSGVCKDRIYVVGGTTGLQTAIDMVYYSSPSTVARTLSIKLSGEHDYLPWENVKVKVAALVADVNTMEPVSDANVTITIYDAENNLWINDTMTEKLNTGIYLWESSETVREIFRRNGKGVYVVHGETSFNGGLTASDILTFHVDPPPEDNNNQLPTIIGISVAAIAIIASAAVFIKKKRNP